MAYYALQQGLQAVLESNGFIQASREEGDAVIITHWVGARVTMASITYSFEAAGYKCAWNIQRCSGKGWTFYYPTNLDDSAAFELVVIKVKPQ